MKTNVIDYKATLQEFFKAVILFLDNRACRVTSELDYRKVCNAREAVKKIAGNPKKYSDYAMRVTDGVEPQPEAFMPNPYDNSAYLILSKVLHHMGNLDSEFDWYRQDAEAVLLRAQRAMAYKNSKNIFNSVKLAFTPEHKFAVRKEIVR